MARSDSTYSPYNSGAPKRPRKSNSAPFVILALAFAAVLGAIFFPTVRAHLGNLWAAPANEKMNPAVVVWANRNFGSYYCSGSPEYGKGEGRYLGQGEALTMGFQPDLGRYCKQQEKDPKGDNEKPEHPSAEDHYRSQTHP